MTTGDAPVDLAALERNLRRLADYIARLRKPLPADVTEAALTIHVSAVGVHPPECGPKLLCATHRQIAELIEQERRTR